MFALHFEASHSQHCPREAAVFGFWEEPAWLLHCAFKMSSSDSHFAIKRSWSNSGGSKTLHALEEGGLSQSGLQIGSHGVRAQVASIGDPLPPIAPLQSQESGSLKDPDTMKWIFRDKSILIAKSASSIR